MIHGMQVKSMDEFMHILDCAIVFEMPKLLACCEHHICTDTSQRFQPMLSRSDRSISLPLSSALRIAKGLQVAFQEIAKDPAASRPDQGSKCGDCDTCRRQIRYGSGRGPDRCRKHGSDAVLRKYMPSPKEFFEMARG